MTQPALQLPIALLCVLAGFLFRRHWASASVVRWSNVLEFLALRVLLPLLIFESFIQSDAPSHWKASLLIGFCTPLLIWCLAIAFARSPIRGSPWGESAVLACTFGGGNRGVALLTIALGGSVHLSPALRAFVLVDLGNLLCMLLILPLVFGRFFSPHGRASAMQSNAVWRAVRGVLTSPAVGVFAVVFICMWAKDAQWPIEAGLSTTSGGRKLALTFCVFSCIGLKLNLDGFGQPPQGFGNALSVWGRTLTLRLTAAAIIGTAAWMGSASGAADAAAGVDVALANWPLVAALVLMALPPSSLLPVLLQRTDVQALQFQRICTQVVAANLGYLIVLVGAAAVGTLAA